MVLSPVGLGGIMLTVEVIQRFIATKHEQIKLYLNCPKNQTRWLLQMFFTHLLLPFIHHPFAELISSFSNLLKKFITALECVSITCSCMLLRKIQYNNCHQLW
jgi:hypothetical protein